MGQEQSQHGRKRRKMDRPERRVGVGERYGLRPRGEIGVEMREAEESEDEDEEDEEVDATAEMEINELLENDPGKKLKLKFKKSKT
jgi:Ran GTPase-activating protein (RanGAP) involved in mRNA processing and transport